MDGLPGDCAVEPPTECSLYPWAFGTRAPGPPGRRRRSLPGGPLRENKENRRRTPWAAVQDLYRWAWSEVRQFSAQDEADGREAPGQRQSRKDPEPIPPGECDWNHGHGEPGTDFGPKSMHRELAPQEGGAGGESPDCTVARTRPKPFKGLPHPESRVPIPWVLPEPRTERGYCRPKPQRNHEYPGGDDAPVHRGKPGKSTIVNHRGRHFQAYDHRAPKKGRATPKSHCASSAGSEKLPAQMHESSARSPSSMGSAPPPIEEPARGAR